MARKGRLAGIARVMGDEYHQNVSYICMKRSQ